MALYEAGSNETESATAAAQSVADDLMRHGEAPVSYTHLTLPTILRV